MMMLFYEKARQCIELGATLQQIGAHNVKETLSRMKSSVKNDDLSQMDDIENQLRKDLGEIETRYRSRKMGKDNQGGAV
jgi:3-deoxy-D-manno-octulosonic-acid transferase